MPIWTHTASCISLRFWPTASTAPSGDVTFWREDMPIVIGDRRFRGKGIGGKVVAALIARGRALGWDRLGVAEIYDHNAASRALL